jgi:thiamine biosynthesis lipoprotein
MLPLLLALLLGAMSPASPSTAPLRITSQAFGSPVEIEVRGLSRETAQEAIQKALAEIAEAERLTGSGLAGLSSAAGKGPQAVDPRLLPLLTRAREFCFWSDGAHGPLGRDLYRVWADPAEPPSPEQAEQAAGLAKCDRLALDPKNGTAALAEGSGLDLRGFAAGYAVDRAVEVLKKEGAANVFVRIGAVQRGAGAGPGGKGWPVDVPPLDRIYLLDRSLAVVVVAPETLLVNQRTGRRAQGVLAAAAVTDLAVDAQGLASTMFITGPREGQLRLGSLRPRPSARWFLGTGDGEPLRVDYRWSEVARK